MSLSLSPEESPTVRTTEDLVRASARLAASTDRRDLAARLAGALVRLTGASSAVVSLSDALACRGGSGRDAAVTAARRVRACDELWASVVSLTPVAIDRSSRRDARRVVSAIGGEIGVVAGVDDEADPGFVVIAGAGVEPLLDQPVVAALAELAGVVLGHLASAERAQVAADVDRSTGFLTVAALERRVASLVDDAVPVGLVTVELEGLTSLAAGFGAATSASVARDVGARISTVSGVLAIAALSSERLAVLCAGDAGAIGDQVVAVATEPVRVGRHQLVLRAHAGAAGPGPSTSRVLLERAELARAEAAATGAPIVVHTRALSEGCHRRLELAAQLWRALEQDEVVVHFQPQVDADGRLLAFEALARWRLSDGTMVPPSAFLPVAEQAGMMAELDLHVLDRACRQLVGWGAAGDGVRLAVNLSASTLARPGIADAVLTTVAAAGLDPVRLELEITETDAAAEHGWLDTLARFRSFGITIALDDFGAGFSSLGRIHRLPLDRLKVDRSFVADLAGAGAAVVRAVLALADELGLAVLAEGVEDEATRVALAALGCRELQGYLFGAALTPDEAGEVLRRR